MPRAASVLADRRVRYGLVALYAASVLAASVVAPPSGGGLPPRGPLGVVGADKWLHAATYWTMGVAVAFALAARRARPLAAAVVLAAGFGAGVEVVQAPLAARTADAADAAANAAGALAGVACWAVGVAVFERVRGW